LKKDVITNIEEIKKERKLSREVEKNILNKIIANGAICISLNILIYTFALAVKVLPMAMIESIYNISSIVFLIFSIIVIEIAYKKDSGKWAIMGIEILFVAIFVLFAPYIFIKYQHNNIYVPIIIVTVYYIFKIILIYGKEKKKYLAEQSEISDIIQKESNDELAKQEKERIKEEKRKQKEKEEKKRKTEKTKKEKVTKKQGKTTTKKSTKTKNSSKKTNKKEETTENTENVKIKKPRKTNAAKKDEKEITKKVKKENEEN